VVLADSGSSGGEVTTEHRFYAPFGGEFLKLVLPRPEAHRCPTPDPSVSSLERQPKFDYGTIWRCECGRTWKLVYIREVYLVGQYVTRWRPYPRWYDRTDK
jgi:hypothetical protein